MGISERIKAIRDEKRIKQIDVATSLNLDPSYYARLEKRGSKMTVEQLQSIADALGVSLGELLGIEPTTSTEKKEDEIRRLKKEVKLLEDSFDASNHNRQFLELAYQKLVSSLRTAATYEVVLNGIRAGIVSKEDCREWFSFDIETAGGYLIPIEVSREALKRGTAAEDVYPSRVMTESQLLAALDGLSYWIIDCLLILFTQGEFKDKVLDRVVVNYYRELLFRKAH